MNKTRSLVLTGLFAALLALTSPLMIPVGGFPLTLQPFFVALCGRVLKGRRAVEAVVVWLLLGLVGLPVFSGFRGGAGVLFGPTGGFLWGFLFLALGCGRVQKKKPLSLLLPLGGLIACHGVGGLWYAFSSSLPLFEAFATSSFPFLGKDFILLLFALWVGKLGEKALSVEKN